MTIYLDRDVEIKRDSSHIGNINILTFLSLFVKDLAVVVGRSCIAPVGKRESNSHCSDFHEHQV